MANALQRNRGNAEEGRLASRPPRSQGTRRVWYYYLRLWGNGGLLISFRLFRTARHRRSKRYRQWVMAIPGGNFRWREVAIRSMRRHDAQQFLSGPNIGGNYHRRSPWRHLRQAVTALILAAALGSAVHFGLQLSRPSSITVLQPAVIKVPSHATRVATKTQVVGPTLPRSVPTQLTIPSVGISTSLETVGLNADGTIHVPDNEHTAGWYQDSPTPGEVGPAIIVGHLDGAYDTGVFWNLNKVQVGDTIQITRTDGQTHTFTVTDVRQVSRDNFPTNDVYGNINYAGLRLITCGGTFDTSTHEYTLNTVVFASLTS